MVALSLALISGCSLYAVQGIPRDRRPGEPLDCTTSYKAPAIDTALAAVTVGVGVGLFIRPPACGTRGGDSTSDCQRAVIGTYFVGLPVLVIGAIAAGNAFEGYKMVSACRAAKKGGGAGFVEVAQPPWPFVEVRARVKRIVKRPDGTALLVLDGGAGAGIRWPCKGTWLVPDELGRPITILEIRESETEIEVPTVAGCEERWGDCADVMFRCPLAADAAR